MAFQEACHHKRIYDKKAGAIELQPGDRVLVKMDAFWGQRRKLKNRWSDDLWRVVWQVAGNVPAYVVRSTKTGKAKVLHWVQLLLWLADFMQDGLEVNVLRLEDDTPPSTMLEALPIRENNGGTPLEPVYDLDLAMFGYSLDTSTSTMDPEVQEMPNGGISEWDKPRDDGCRCTGGKSCWWRTGVGRRPALSYDTSNNGILTRLQISLQPWG